MSGFKIKLILNLTLSLLILAAPAAAQVSFTNLGTDLKIKSCDDFATSELNNAWDMSDSADINNFFPELDIQGLSNVSFANGNFNATTNSTAGLFFLFSPQACGAYPVGGRWGQNLSLDTSKYKSLSIRMYTDVADPLGFRTLWNRDCNYASNRNITTPIPIKAGWHTYTVDLSSGVGFDSSGLSTPWTNGSITGLGIIPTTLNGSNIKIDSIRLEDSASCGSSAINYTASASGNDSLYTVWIDDDTNPFNGYIKQISTAASAAGASSSSLNSLGLAPGNYKAIGLLHGDFRTLEATDPWDMNESTDVLVTAAVNNAGFSGGTYNGVSANEAPAIYFKVGDGGINTSKYNKVSFKISRNGHTGNMFLIWDNGAQLITPDNHVGGDVYQVDLSGNAGWTGTTTNFILRPALQGGVSFSLDFISLRAAGFVNSLDSNSLSGSLNISTANIVINTPPSIEILEPDLKGGEAFMPWNMNNGDFQIFENLEGDTDPAFPNETYSLYLPDVREIDGLRGDFFKGSNIDGNIDPVNYSTYLSNPANIDSSQYKNLCFKMYMNTAFSIGGGSVGRAIWISDEQGGFKTSEDILLIYDGWSGSQWYEYCIDMTKIHLDDETDRVGNWSGTISSFRIDPHEFTPLTTYYFDYIKLRKDDNSKGKYNIALNFTDSDDTSSVSLYYTTAETATNGSLITTFNEGQASYLWDTSGVPAGSYLIYAVATDGLNTVTRKASGRISVSNSGISNTQPSMSLETPVNNQVVCNNLQVKGYAVQSDRNEEVSLVEIFADDVLLKVTKPSLYSINAKANFPNADSSNTGFNENIDITSLSAGAHVIKVRAVSSDGAENIQTFNVTKQGTNCPATIIDPSPSGSPVVIPNVELPDNTKPVITKIRHDANGTVAISIKDISTEGCVVSLYAGETEDNISNLLASVTVTAEYDAKDTFSMEAKKVKINKKKVKTLHFKSTKQCSGFKTAESANKKLGIKTTKGSSTAASAISSIKAKLKILSPGKKGKKKKKKK